MAGYLDGGETVASGPKISNIYVSGIVKGTLSDTGGLIGYARNYAEISSSYSTASVSGNSHVGGLVGTLLANATIKNSYATGKVTGTTNVGGLVGRSGASDPYVNVVDSYWDVDSTGQSTSKGGTGIYGQTSTVNAYTQTTYIGFDFTNTWWMVDGSTRPFLRSEWNSNITNSHQLQLMALRSDASYTLANNIDLASSLTSQSDMWSGTLEGANFQASWIPIGKLRPAVYDAEDERWSDTGADTAFSGNFDGQNHSISGLTILRPTDYPSEPADGDLVDSNGVGLFGYVSGENSAIRNLTLIDAQVQGHSYVGALVGSFAGDELANINVQNATVLGGNLSSDAVGIDVGAVAGSVSGNASQLTATGTVGGVDGTSRNLGGLIGRFATGTLSDSWADVAVTGRTVGGLVGINEWNGVITGSRARGVVTGTGTVAGLVADNQGAITQSYATGAVNHTGSANNAGGLVASNSGTISQSYATGNVSAPNASFVGGLVGYMGEGRISRSYATGKVQGQGGVGGLVGYANLWAGELMLIEQSFASGDVEASGEHSGGLVGRASGVNITDTFALGDVSGTGRVGGLVGEFAGYNIMGNPKITRSYAVGSVTGDELHRWFDWL